MKELKAMHDFLVNEVQEEYNSYVASNWKINSLTEALKQIHDIGDISSEPAKKGFK